MIFEAGEYRLELFPEETRAYYRSSRREEETAAAPLLRLLLPRAKKESLALLNTMGILPEKLCRVSLLAEPDETGCLLLLVSAPLCAVLLQGGERIPRQSAEKDGLSMVFLPNPGYHADSDPAEPSVLLRFVWELPWDPEVLSRI